MVDKVISLTSGTSLFAIVITTLVFGPLLIATSTKMIFSKQKKTSEDLAEPSALTRNLAAALPDSVLLPQHGIEFRKSAEHHWAQQASQVVPACVVRPRNVEELSKAVKMLSSVARDGSEGSMDGLFAVRSGGHSWVTGASGISGGTLIDLSLFCNVELSEDKTSVVIGTGARWGEVSKVLEKKGVAVVGGRNSDVGVGGFILGGGISFFSPRFGLACSNVISYEVVLASGSVVEASESSNPDLWRALKGGSNNFGIVTRFTVRCFPQGKVWGGYIHLPAYQTTKVLSAFHDFVRRADPAKDDILHDENAAGPMACFSYIHAIRMEVISVHLAYTKIPDNQKGWPTYWKTSAFSSFWRYWSTCANRTLTHATDELESLNSRGKRQQQTTMIMKNDPATLATAHSIFREDAALLRRAGVKGLIWTLVVQPLYPDWLRKGDPNPMGLDGCQDTLVLALYVAVWEDPKDDVLVSETVKLSTKKLEAAAAANGTLHRYKYLNYCGDGQEPLQSYGEEGLRLLKEVSKKYDPDGVFQKQCIGGFKLNLGSGS